MNNPNDIKSYNDKGKPHGYWEVYWYNGNIHYKGMYHNGKEVGYWFESSSAAASTMKTYYIK